MSIPIFLSDIPSLDEQPDDAHTYNLEYGDERLCKCTHEYYRHFDTCDNMRPIGCKDCECAQFEQPDDGQEVDTGECLGCGRRLPPDGDCYGCAADIAWARIAELESQLEQAKEERDSAENKMQMFADISAKYLSERDAAEAREARLRDVLQKVEWTVYGNRERCPWCHSFRPQRHKPDCARQDALQPAPNTKEKSDEPTCTRD